MWTRAILAASLVAGTVGLAWTDDKPVDRAEIDRRVAKSVFEATQLGTTMFNKNNHEGCFRLYQGTLLAVNPLLDHRPKLAALVKEKLDKAANLQPVEGAFVLREALDAVQKETGESFFEKKEPKKPLWERLGGEKAAKAVVHDFVDELVKDKKVDLTRGGKLKIDEKDIEKLKQTTADLLSNILGGPKQMVDDPTAVLAKMKFTDDEFKVMLTHLAAALKKNKIPDAETIEMLELAAQFKQFIVIVPK
jgi:hemoglobin